MAIRRGGLGDASELRTCQRPRMKRGLCPSRRDGLLRAVAHGSPILLPPGLCQTAQARPAPACDEQGPVLAGSGLSRQCS